MFLLPLIVSRNIALNCESEKKNRKFPTDSNFQKTLRIFLSPKVKQPALRESKFFSAVPVAGDTLLPQCVPFLGVREVQTARWPCTENGCDGGSGDTRKMWQLRAGPRSRPPGSEFLLHPLPGGVTWGFLTVSCLSALNCNMGCAQRLPSGTVVRMS